MTRRSTLALVTLLAGLLSLVPVSAVTAHSGCTGYAREHCEQMADANDAALFRITAIASPVHPFSSNGIAREHFEAMSMAQPDRFVIAPSGPAAGVSSSVMTIEEQKFLEQMTIEEQRFLEVKTILPVPVPASYMEHVTPLPDQAR